MFRKVIAVYCKNETKQIITLGGRVMQILFIVTIGGIYR